jgi:formylglycine-generating enzyme required for sulfatase activity
VRDTATTQSGQNAGTQSAQAPGLAAPGPAPAKNMIWIPGGEFLMGSDDFYPEERPVHPVSVDGFWIDEHPVTVAQFRRFVKATGHVTWAELTPNAADYPDADPDLLVPGSLVFESTTGPVDLSDVRNWWSWMPGAQWRHPEGPDSTVHGRELHPVTHVAYQDAVAYAEWIGKQLPTEAQWERAARGGLEGKVFCWGDEFAPRGKMMANTWQGQFPWENLMYDRFERTSPVKSFSANGFGLYDMAGNVWEWTSDFFTPRHGDSQERPCCTPHNPRVTAPGQSYDLGAPGADIPRRVTKGGSHLCAPNYCLRYRPAARQGEAVDTSTGHIGFRCVLSP